ncbi:hypothetical protein ABT061_10385 [Streptosporangium sp. NPDC002544]
MNEKSRPQGKPESVKLHIVAFSGICAGISRAVASWIIDLLAPDSSGQ